MYKCYFCNKQFKEPTYYDIHIDKNLCTFISNSRDVNIDINSYLHYLNKKKRKSSSIDLTYSKNI